MSVLKVNTIEDTSGNERFTATAWVNFNGTGVVAIRDSGNVSSITDVGVGDYTLNFTVAMTNANYGFSGSLGHTENSLSAYNLKMRTSERVVGGLGIRTVAVTDVSAVVADFNDVHVVIFGGR